MASLPACVIHGGYAESALCAAATVPVPDGVDPVAAAALVLNYLIDRQMLHRVLGARPGQRILVHGAAGGVGITLLDLSRAAGITASRGKHAVLRDYGAQAIDHNAEDFAGEAPRTDKLDAVWLAKVVGARHAPAQFRTS